MLKGAGGGGGGITPGTTVITGGTNTRVLFDDNGVVGESAGLTYVKGTGTLSATAVVGGNLTDSALTSGRVTLAGTAGLLSDNASLTFSGTTLNSGGFTALSVTELAPALTAGNWTVGSGWESPIVGPGLIKNADGTGTQTPSAATNIVAGTTYKVTITLSALSVGSATYTVGGVTGASTLNSAATFTDYVTTSTTGKLIITPTNTSRFTISAISILAVGDFNGTIGVTKPAPAAFTTVTTSGAVTLPPGTTSLPSINFTGSLTTGLSAASAGVLDFSGGGIRVLAMSSAAFGQLVGFYYIGSNARMLISTTKPTVASGGCTSPTAVTSDNTAVFSVGVGTSCSGSQPLVFTLPAATTGWQCTARNTSNAATSAPAQSSAVSTTSVTITNYSRTLGTAAAWTDADVVAVSCLGY